MMAAPVVPIKKKEKPKEKIPIPGTTWTKVITTLDNVFYTEKASKRSSWTIPDEIKDEVESYEEGLRADRLKREQEERTRREEQRLADLRERERVRLELEEERKNKVDLEKRKKKEADKERERKRKERDGEDDLVVVEGDERQDDDQDGPRASKMARLDDQAEDDEAAADADDGDGEQELDPATHSDEEEAAMGPVDEDDEEAWQRAVAAEIARETKIKDKQKKEQKAAKKAQEAEAKNKLFQAPVQVELNPEEGKALFMASRGVYSLVSIE